MTGVRTRGRIRSSPPRLPAAVACTALAIAFASCGEEESPAAPERQASALGDVRVGSVAQLAQCSDWRRGDRDERLATIDDIRSQINLQDGTVQTPPLSDELAYEVLDGMCANDFARSFRLYKVYARAAGFQSLAE